AAALEVARSLQIPVLMEPTAGVRPPNLAITHHALVADSFIDEVSAVVSIGRFGLGRHLRRLCERTPLHIAFAALGRGADPYATADTVLPLEQCASSLSRSTAANNDWLERWLTADRAADAHVRTQMGEWAEQPTGAHIADEVLTAATEAGAVVFAAASRAIRDVDLMCPADAADVVANLGVNGIDGLVSTGVGLALQSSTHTYALLGDLAFLHGSNGLLIPNDEPQPNLTIVVNDDNGGAIFSDLEQGAPEFQPWFERVFGTPHDVDLVALARAYGATAVEVFDLSQLRSELKPATGIKVVVVVGADRELSREFRASLRRR
ncbi:MAG: hypothetical protein RL745_142, partial [Actinomycetota bacterium]